MIKSFILDVSWMRLYTTWEFLERLEKVHSRIASPLEVYQTLTVDREFCTCKTVFQRDQYTSGQHSKHWVSWLNIGHTDENIDEKAKFKERFVFTTKKRKYLLVNFSCYLNPVFNIY